MAVLHTIGHGTREVPELAALLEGAGVRVLIDVRRHPGSRRNPQLSGPGLAVELPASWHVTYEWWGEELGGRRSSPGESRHPAWRNTSFRAYADHMDTGGFRAALSVLLARVADEQMAVMCAETLWWRCHRRLLADAATLQGAEVVHLLGEGRSTSHPLHPAVRADAEGWPVYDLGAPASLWGDEGEGDHR